MLCNFYSHLLLLPCLLRAGCLLFQALFGLFPLWDSNCCWLSSRARFGGCREIRPFSKPQLMYREGNKDQFLRATLKSQLRVQPPPQQHPLLHPFLPPSLSNCCHYHSLCAYLLEWGSLLPYLSQQELHLASYFSLSSWVWIPHNMTHSWGLRSVCSLCLSWVPAWWLTHRCCWVDPCELKDLVCCQTKRYFSVNTVFTQCYLKIFSCSQTLWIHHLAKALKSQVRFSVQGVDGWR